MNWKSPEETHAVMLGVQSVTNTFHIFILLYDTWVIKDTDSTIISIQARKHSAIQVLVGLKVFVEMKVKKPNNTLFRARLGIDLNTLVFCINVFKPVLTVLKYILCIYHTQPQCTHTQGNKWAAEVGECATFADLTIWSLSLYNRKRPSEVLLENGTQGASSLRTKFHILSGPIPWQYV